MKTPSFWYSAGPSYQSSLLKPFSYLYRALQQAHYKWRARKKAYRPQAHTICIGNITAGGAGKTPVVLALYDLLQERGKTVTIISRGYGGKLQGPARVDPSGHSAADVGDEPLMIANRGKNIWISKQRTGAIKAVEAQSDVILFDDGFQNPSIHKDKSLIVLDGTRGTGNNHMIPAGPLREAFEDGIQRSSSVVIIGSDKAGLREVIDAAVPGHPVFQASMIPDPKTLEVIKGQKLAAFAGIGMPEKFFETLAQSGAPALKTYAFADHHAYLEDEILNILLENPEALIVTTEKDFVRVPDHLKSRILAVPINLRFENPEKLLTLLMGE